MAQENDRSSTASPAPFTTEELRAAVCTLLSLAAEHEWREGTLTAPPGFPWLPAGDNVELVFPEAATARSYPLIVHRVGAPGARGLADSTGSLGEKRHGRDKRALSSVVTALLACQRDREADRALDEQGVLEARWLTTLAGLVEAERGGRSSELPDGLGTRAAEVPKPSKRQRDEGDRSVPMLLDDKARERVVCAAVAMANPAWSLDPTKASADARMDDVDRLAPLVAATAEVLDGEGVVDRFEHSDYPAIARYLLRAANGVKGRGGKPRSGSSLRELADEVDADSDRETSRDRGALKNRRQRAVLFALTALGCAGDITAAVIAAEPLHTTPKPRL